MKYMEFKNRNWSYLGDKKTWCREEDNGTYTLQIALKGMMSDGFINELCEFINSHEVISGKPFTSYGGLNAGERVSLK